MTTVTAIIQIKADDGDVQVEPFTFTDSATATASTFLNTGLTFFINRKQGAVVDMQIPACSTATRVRFKVNGKDTGVALLLAGLVSTVNNRIPTTIPIAAGAAVQILNE